MFLSYLQTSKNKYIYFKGKIYKNENVPRVMKNIL